MQRRHLLKLGWGSALVLAGAGGAVALWQPGLDGSRLTASGRRAMGAVARAVLDGALPNEPAALERHLTNLETTLSGFPPPVQAELQQLMSLLVNAPARLGLLGHWRALDAFSVTELQGVLESLRHSRLALRQQVYFALRDLHSAAFYAQPEAWGAIGYPGPTAL